ncbi:hypothetical protein HUT16_32675 [Kitasatospora sp. NA04385]|uniref:hypothetical protein n=1 Tax=Kitasatospora sp. NA04385 TaxID=2742135 RepID=UPI001590A879|nr:hypothetical protein [Kitasatospora sp. NA04385]QKW23206.1 hypothetical protein HUT16_32675 [Kitasatospora sp. NA04385]
MGEDLDTVEWAALKHEQGSAADLPGLLRACAGDDEEAAEDAAAEIHDRMVHLGGWICSAAPAALPFLLRLAADPARPPTVRRSLLETLDMLSGRPAAHVPPGTDGTWWAAWERALPQTLALLDDPLPAIRRDTARMLTSCPTPGRDLLPALLRRLRTEDDPVTRLCLLTALGAARRREPAGPQGPGARAMLRALLADGDLQERLGALLALAPEDLGLPARHADLVARALRDPAVRRWEEDGGPGHVHGRARRLFPAPAPATAFVRALLRDHPDAAHRAAALEQAGDLLAERRSPAPHLLPALAAHLDDPEPEVRLLALDLLARLGPAAVTPHADRIAALLDDADPTVAALALWALARGGDPRCAPALNAAPETFGDADHHLLRLRTQGITLPALSEVLARLPGQADALMPVVERRLARDGHPSTVYRYGRVLTGWGAASPAAVERLLARLAEDRVWAVTAETLAGLGPAVLGADATARARAMISARMNGPDVAAATAAWACWRLGGDPEAAVDALAAHLDDHDALRMLGDLGPHAARCAAPLRVRAADRSDWVRVRAASALWAATGDTGTAVPALIAALRGLDQGRHRPVMPVAVRQLARIGPAARPAAPLLRAALAEDRRLRSHGGWHGFAEDEELRAAAAGALAAFGE